MEAFVRGGHQVDALVRNSERAAHVHARGAHPVLGDLTKPSSYADAAASADGIVHAAAVSSSRAADVDAIALASLLGLDTSRQRFLIYTSAGCVLGPTSSPADEMSAPNPLDVIAWRTAHEQRVLDAAGNGMRTAVVRPGIVYGGYQGTVGDLFKDAANGLVRVIGTGENRWPLVYDRDLGDLYLRLAVTPQASGVFHANDEGDERVNDIVAAIAAHVAIRPSVRHVPIAEARKKQGGYADVLALDQVVRSPRARAIGWNPSLHSVAGNAARLFEEWRRGKEAA
jgi:nucleoside-diphosphate-sugar epimerase